MYSISNTILLFFLSDKKKGPFGSGGISSLQELVLDVLHATTQHSLPSYLGPVLTYPAVLPCVLAIQKGIVGYLQPLCERGCMTGFKSMGAEIPLFSEILLPPP